MSAKNSGSGLKTNVLFKNFEKTNHYERNFVYTTKHLQQPHTYTAVYNHPAKKVMYIRIRMDMHTNPWKHNTWSGPEFDSRQLHLTTMIFVGLCTKSCIAKPCAYAMPPFWKEMEEFSNKIHSLDL